MPQSLAYNYIHLIFSTKNREPIIFPEIEDKLYGYISGIGKNLECQVLKIGGIPDHIHILFALSKKISLAEFVEEVKKSSSKWIKHREVNTPIFIGKMAMAPFLLVPNRLIRLSNTLQPKKSITVRKRFNRNI